MVLFVNKSINQSPIAQRGLDFGSTKAADPDQGERNNTSERIHKAKIQGLTRSGGLLPRGNHITVTVLFF